MNSTGFLLTRLMLSGKGVQDAQVEFKRGLNVITGPSDTGKTFIAQCINFMLGGSKPLEEIPEAAPYELVTLGIRRSSDNHEVLFERSIKGGKIRLIDANGNDQVLGEKHQADSELTVSYYLLHLSGLAGSKIRTNKYGATRTLSFRDISKLIYIDEESVISKTSPVLSGQHQDKTAETSVFSLLLTGTDDSSIVQQIDSKTAKIRSVAETDLLNDLIEKTNARIIEIGIQDDASSVRDRLFRIKKVIEQTTSELNIEQKNVSDIETERKDMWTELRHIDSSISVLSELQQRFSLLKQQYFSDLRRLDSISEVAFRLDQLKEERCPVCGSLAKYHVQDHKNAGASPAEVAKASLAEKAKITILLEDLEITITDTASRLKLLNTELNEKTTNYQSIHDKIQDTIQPKLQTLLLKIRDNQIQYDMLVKVEELYERIEEYTLILDSDDTNVSTVEKFKTVGMKEAEYFAKDVEDILRSWHFPALDRVTYNERSIDLIISGQPRSSHGKGVRAIIHAAFNLALLKYCTKHSKPHPGLVLIDSPLVVYKEPDKDERGFAPELKTNFYRSLSQEFSALQVIIFENEAPPIDVEDRANVIKFTGSKLIGKYGFIPVL